MSQFYNKLWLHQAWLQAKTDLQKGLRGSGYPHLTVATENKIKTLALPVFLSCVENSSLRHC